MISGSYNSTFDVTQKFPVNFKRCSNLKKNYLFQQYNKQLFENLFQKSVLKAPKNFRCQDISLFSSSIIHSGVGHLVDNE
jgi:hypothetical protein